MRTAQKELPRCPLDKAIALAREDGVFRRDLDAPERSEVEEGGAADRNEGAADGELFCARTAVEGGVAVNFLLTPMAAMSFTLTRTAK